MSNAIDRDVIFEMMQQEVAEMDHLVQPVIDSLFEEVERWSKQTRKQPIIAGAPMHTSRRELIQMSLRSERVGYEQDGARGRVFVLDVIEKYLEQMWEEDVDV